MCRARRPVMYYPLTSHTSRSAELNYPTHDRECMGISFCSPRVALSIWKGFVLAIRIAYTPQSDAVLNPTSHADERGDGIPGHLRAKPWSNVQGSHNLADVSSSSPRRLPERPLLWAGWTDGCETVCAALMRSDPDGGLNRRLFAYAHLMLALQF
jgi:hypothetical protein